MSSSETTGGTAATAPRRWLARALLVTAVALTFANAIDNQFVYDDRNLIVDAPAVRQPLTDGFAGLNYRPLRTLSYRIDYALGGMDPRVFHASNLVYHAATTLVVFGLLGAAGASTAAATAGALVFAVHPVQADAVAYASGRRDVLCGLFYAIGVLAYVQCRHRGRRAGMIVVAVAYVLAILAKEMAVTMPVACVLVDRWRLARAGRSEGRSRGFYAAGLVAVGTIGGAALALTYGRHVVRMATERPWHGGSFAANIATVARVLTTYLGLIVWPVRLSADYSYDAFSISTTLADPRALASIAVLALLAGAAIASWRRGGWLGLGLAWMAVTLLPVSHLVPFRELLAEHYLYIPMMGVALIVAGAVDVAVARWPERRRLVAATIAVTVLAAAGRTVVRNRDWQDPVTLWSATVAVAPRCVRAQYNLGQAYFERSRLTDAERAWLAAAALQPDDPDTARGLAMLYYRLGKYDLAATQLAPVLATRRRDAEALTLAGWIALDSGKPSRALDYFQDALAILPPDKAAGARTGHERAVRVLNPSPGQIVDTMRGGGRPFKQ